MQATAKPPTAASSPAAAAQPNQYVVSRNTAMTRDSGCDIVHCRLMVHVIPVLQGPSMTNHYRHSLLAAATAAMPASHALTPSAASLAISLYHTRLVQAAQCCTRARSICAHCSVLQCTAQSEASVQPAGGTQAYTTAHQHTESLMQSCGNVSPSIQTSPQGHLDCATSATMVKNTRGSSPAAQGHTAPPALVLAQHDASTAPAGTLAANHGCGSSMLAVAHDDEAHSALYTSDTGRYSTQKPRQQLAMATVYNCSSCLWRHQQARAAQPSMHAPPV